MNTPGDLGTVFRNSGVKEKFLSFIGKLEDVTEDEAWKWLRSPPQDTVVRVNTIKSNAGKAVEEISEYLRERGVDNARVTVHESMKDVIVIKGAGGQKIIPEEKVVIVGEMCGLAVLRGADVFSPGILSAPVDLVPGDKVAVVADVGGTCLRGSKQFHGETCFV